MRVDIDQTRQDNGVLYVINLMMWELLYDGMKSPGCKYSPSADDHSSIVQEMSACFEKSC